MLGTLKVISFVLAINLVLGGAYTLLDQNITTSSAAVYKTQAIFGYNVTGIIFDVNDTDPAVIDSITFHIAPSSGSAKADHVKIQTKANGPWTECSLVDDVLPTRVATCTLGSLAAEDVTALKIVAQ